MEEILKSIAQGGPLAGWGFCCLCILAIVFLYKKVNEIQEARLADLRQANKISDDIKDAILPLVTSLGAIQSTLEVLKDRSKQ